VTGKRPYRRYVTASSRPTETPSRSVALVCALCGHPSTVALTLEAMTDLPHHCGQPMLIKGTSAPLGQRRPSANP
jgi:hypothetical protein